MKKDEIKITPIVSEKDIGMDGNTDIEVYSLIEETCYCEFPKGRLDCGEWDVDVEHVPNSIKSIMKFGSNKSAGAIEELYFTNVKEARLGAVKRTYEKLGKILKAHGEI